MAESLISERIVFSKKSDQGAFLCRSKKCLGMSWVEISRLLCVSTKSIHDWSKGKFKMPYSAAKLLSARSGVKLPLSTKVISWNEHLRGIAHLGGLSVINKYKQIGSDEFYRKKRWKEWWEREGKFNNKLQSKRIHVILPVLDEKLAEFVGIMMGDGGVAPYHISITLNSETDARYKNYVVGLIVKLFKLEPKVYKRKDCKAVAIIVQRKEIVDFCFSIGLPKGNKLRQGLEIPRWIQENRNNITAFIRGLFDTDGSVFKHSYVAKGKRYSYVNVSLSNRFLPLLKMVQETLINCGISVRISKDQSEIRIEGQDSVDRYVNFVGTHNHKHQDKIDHWRSARAVNRTGC